MSYRNLISGVIVFAGLLAPFLVINALAQQGARRTILDKQDLSVAGREGVYVLTELDPGAREPNHTHPGDLFAYVLQGTVTLYQEGMPTKKLDAGGVFFILEGKVHAAANEGTVPVKLLVTFFAEKGKPLTTPVAK
jgi:quercetin dioxygenase-like cupin family protein